MSLRSELPVQSESAAPERQSVVGTSEVGDEKGRLAAFISAAAVSGPTLGAACAGCVGASLGAATVGVFLSPRTLWQPALVVAISVAVTLASSFPYSRTSLGALSVVVAKGAVSASLMYVGVVGVLTLAQAFTGGGTPGSPVLP
jgi:1,4-dihydroxy-2-naphthoate octaprenyltransferase